MSKIWKKNITLPAWVEVTIKDHLVSVKWPKGVLSYKLLSGVTIDMDWNKLSFAVDSLEKRNLRGLTRTLINNMVVWVSEWYEKKLHILWVWYSCKIQWSQVVFNLWYSHPINFDLPKGVGANQEKDSKWNDILILQSIDKQQLGQVCAQMRVLRPPEPYKGKGVRFFWEVIKLKAGKTAKK
jgi:large subunit ribosomal protein L6